MSFLQDVNPESENRVNDIAAESQNNEVRVQFADEVSNDNSAQDLTPLDEIETNEEDENRNKRFLFGLGGGSGGSAGSGNFLFDIIRVSRVSILKKILFSVALREKWRTRTFLQRTEIAFIFRGKKEIGYEKNKKTARLVIALIMVCR